MYNSDPVDIPVTEETLRMGMKRSWRFLIAWHVESLAIFSKLNDDTLLKKCTTPGGIEITVWKWLRAMIEHEIHHRGQIYVYLGLLGISTPPIYGLNSVEVKRNSIQQDR